MILASAIVLAAAATMPPDRVAVQPEPLLSRARYVAARDPRVRGLALPAHEAFGWSQRARLLPDGSTEVTVVSLPRGARPVPGAAPPAPPDGAASTTPGARELSEEIAHGTSDAWTVSERVLTWVSLNLVHDETLAEESAASALASRRASCVGRSLLAVELLRAAGIPARTIHGLLADAHSNERPFLLHRFVETWIDGVGWVPSDPGESIHVVDARHLFIATDERPYDPESQRSLRLRPAERPHVTWSAPRDPGLRPLVVADRPPRLLDAVERAVIR